MTRQSGLRFPGDWGECNDPDPPPKNSRSSEPMTLGGFIYRLSCFLALIGTFALIIWSASKEVYLQQTYGNIGSALIFGGGTAPILLLWGALYKWGCRRNKHR